MVGKLATNQSHGTIAIGFFDAMHVSMEGSKKNHLTSGKFLQK